MISYGIHEEVRNRERNIFDMFPTFERCRPSMRQMLTRNIFINNMGASPQKEFSFHIKGVGVSVCMA
jgi:hypothetical protein